MFMSLFPRESHSGFWERDERRRLEVRCDWLEAQMKAVLSAYVTETKRPLDCHPNYRFRVALPDGTMLYRETREEAEALFRNAIPEMP